MLIESAVELLSYSSSYHLIDTNVTWTSDEIQKVSRIKKRRGRFLSLFITSVILGIVPSAGTSASDRSGFS
ncbi:hypothetical protein C2H92_20750 [Bacillus halotolerans]|nr:hypothetical protein C2H92_20750 [Bacillus halotolerans]